MVAEDFFNYVLTKKEGKELILDQRPKRNSLFRKIYNYLKELFTGKVDLQTYYERLYTGNINMYKRNLDNSFFGTLNKGLEGVIDGEIRNLTNAETKNLYQVIDYLFGQAFEKSGNPTTLMFEKNNVVSKIYDSILNTFKKQYNSALDRIDNLEPGTPEYDAEELNLNNLSFAIQNWDKNANIIGNHKRFSSFFKISKDSIKFDEEGLIVDPTMDLLDEESDVNNDRSSSVVKNENVSSKEAASNETIYLIATLGTNKPNPFLPMFNLPVDFKQTWDILTKNLEGTLEYSDLYNKIEKLKSKYEWAESLLKRLPDPKDRKSTRLNSSHSSVSRMPSSA